MEKYSYKISIANPCAESWLQMTPEEKGRFCLNCQKEVVEIWSGANLLCGRNPLPLRWGYDYTERRFA